MTSDQPTPLANPVLPSAIGDQRSASSDQRPASSDQHPASSRSPTGFLAWPGAASLTTLVSAACLLGGIWGVLAQGLDDPAQAGERWAVLATLAAYLASLLAGTWAMCRARAGHPDAVASAVVAALLAVGSGVVLHLVAPAAAAASACAAGAGWCGLLAMWRAWNRISGGSGPAAAWPLAAIGLWALAWPVALGWRTALSGADAEVMPWWCAGWALLALPLLWLWGAALHGPDPWAGAGRPFLARAAMRWVLALVAAAAAVAALAVQAHVAGLDLAWTDLLPHLLVLAAAGNELRARAVGGGMRRDALAVAALPWLAVLCALADALPSCSQVRGEGWAPAAVALTGASPLLPGLAIALALAGWWRRRAPGLLVGAGLAACAGVALADPRHPHLAEALALGLALVAGAAWSRRRIRAAITASVIAAALAAAGGLAQRLLPAAPPALLAAMVGGSTLLLWAGLIPAAVQRSLVQLTAWLLGFIIAAATAWLIHGGSGPDAFAGGVLAGVVGETILLLWCAWRRRDGSVALAAALAGLIALWPALCRLLPDNPAWLGVWAAFALLALAVGLAVRRARRAPR